MVVGVVQLGGECCTTYSLYSMPFLDSNSGEVGGVAVHGAPKPQLPPSFIVYCSLEPLLVSSQHANPISGYSVG